LNIYTITEQVTVKPGSSATTPGITTARLEITAAKLGKSAVDPEIEVITSELR
jgi:hypothetical protein